MDTNNAIPGKVKKPFYKKAWFWIVAVIVVAAIGLSGGSDTESESSQKEVAEKEPVVKEEPAVKEEKKPEVPTEYKSALKKAETYSDMMHMSKAGIYSQLTSEYGEQFTPEAAQYAIDNLQVDYKQNALEKAKTYQEQMSMSPAAIYDQLISEYGEQFTAEEAQYAIDNLE